MTATYLKLLSVLGRQVSDLALGAELEAIGLPMPEIESFDDQSYISFPLRGIVLVSDKDTLTTIQLFARGVEPGVAEYTDELPEKLTFSMGKADVLKALGPAARVGGGAGKKIGPVQIQPWILYHRDGYTLHIQFVASESKIARISLKH